MAAMVRVKAKGSNLSIKTKILVTSEPWFFVVVDIFKYGLRLEVMKGTLGGF